MQRETRAWRTGWVLATCATNWPGAGRNSPYNPASIHVRSDTLVAPVRPVDRGHWHAVGAQNTRRLSMTISRRARKPLFARWAAALVSVLVVGAIARAECPGGSCEQCKSHLMQSVDWTAIYLGNFATGCALANPYQCDTCPEGSLQSAALSVGSSPSAETFAECGNEIISRMAIAEACSPAAATLAHDPLSILSAARPWPSNDGVVVTFSVAPLCCDVPPLECPCHKGADLTHFNTLGVQACEGKPNYESTKCVRRNPCTENPAVRPRRFLS